MAGWLTTHVLDTARGQPAQGMEVILTRFDGDDAPVEVARLTTNADGRTDAPILPEADFRPGTYQLTFHVGDWLRAEGLAGDEPLFLDLVPIRFGMAEATHYHVPLLVSPFGYSTYRGS